MPSLQEFTRTLTDERLDEFRAVGDPAADKVIAAVVDENGLEEAKRIFDLLIRRVEMPLAELPPVMVDFVLANRTLPDWADTRHITTAQDLFKDHGPKFVLLLYFKSLPILYSCGHGAQVLARTARLAHQPESIEIFTRRVAETGQFLLAVMCPEGPSATTFGFDIILKVRLIHAAIRQFVSANSWNTLALGTPVNQEDLAVTLMTFSVALTDGLAQFGVDERSDRVEAFQHYWRIVGSLLGVDEALLPSSTEQASWLLATIVRRQSVESDEGKLLTRALVGFSEQHFRGALLRTTPKVLIRHLVGPVMADKIGVGRDRFWWFYLLLPAFLKKLFRLGERLEDRVGPLEVFAEVASRRIVRASVGYFDTFKGTPFRIPLSLREAWNLARDN